MENYFDVLRRCPLFDGIADANLPAMLRCLNARAARFDKGENVMAEGEAARWIGIVLSGTVHIVRSDSLGNRSLVERVRPSELFGESFACAGVSSIPVNAAAAEPVQVMLLDCLKVTRSRGNVCEFHQRMIYNLLKAVAEKNLVYHQKIEIISKRSTREKLLAYLLIQAKENRSDSFEIPYSRQELADYLEVERSGLSVEIGKLGRQGVIAVDKRRFEILKKADRRNGSL